MRVAYNGVDASAGGGSVTRAALITALTGVYALTSGESWSSPSGVTVDGEITMVTAAGVVSVGAIESHITGARPERGADYDLVLRLDRPQGTNDGRWRTIVRFGRDTTNCGLLRITGAGSMELGYLSDDAWTLVWGAGGNADVRAAWDAGELVVLVRRRAGAVVVAIASGATIADALASGTEVRVSSVDATLLSLSDGELVGVGVEATVDVLPATTTVVREATWAMGVSQ